MRPRGPASQPARDNYDRGDEVNTLVLVNHSKRPLLLLAGEIVTGGKQDRIVAKDRIVPADADPIDLAVFCIEPGRWTESSANFGASGKSAANSFMVQPEVRERAMVDQDQQQVWDSVHGAMSQMEAAAAPPSSLWWTGPCGPFRRSLGTTQLRQGDAGFGVSKKVDEAARPVMKAREQVLAQAARRARRRRGGGRSRRDHLGRPVCQHRFAVALLDQAGSFLRSGEPDGRRRPSRGHVADAQRFLDEPSGGTENSEGEVGIYRYRELKSGGTETFVLESLLPGTGYDVHIEQDEAARRGEPERKAASDEPADFSPGRLPLSTR